MSKASSKIKSTWKLPGDESKGELPLRNPKHETFSQGLVLGKSYYEAYLGAGFNVLNARHAAQAGGRLAKKADIIQRVQYLRQVQANVMLGRFKSDTEELAGRLIRLASYNVKDFLEWHYPEPVVDQDTGLTTQPGLVIRLKDMDEVDGQIVSGIKLDRYGNVSVEFESRLAAYRLLADIMGYTRKKDEEPVDPFPENEKFKETLRLTVIKKAELELSRTGMQKEKGGK